MVYETSYTSGQKPFQPDLQRGKWLHPMDFIFACLGLSLKLEFSVMSGLSGTGVFSIFTYAITIAFYILPMMVLHSFLGQFSSSGFITALRISPIFKGIGYVGLGLSVLNLLYYCIFVAFPLTFLFNSFRPTLPWSCEGWPEWQLNRTEEEKIDICTWNITSMNSTAIDNATLNAIHIPSLMFFRQHFEDLAYYESSGEHILSWSFLGYILIAWAIIAFVFYKYSEPVKFGTFIRNAVGCTFILALVCFVALMQLPNAFSGIAHEMKSINIFEDLYSPFLPVLMFVMQSFGNGFGSIIALSSFNSFNTDIIRHSWIICAGQCLAYVMFSMYLSMFCHYYNQFMITEDIILMFDYRSMLFITSASAIASLKWPNLWSILYYSVIVMASLIVMITQIFTVLSSLFDEFESLRLYKKEVTFSFIAMLTLGSIYFATNQGIEHFPVLYYECMAIQAILHFLLLVAALWFYGRVRLQRDMEFMLGQHFATWRVYLLRILAPVGFVMTLFCTIISSYYEHVYLNSYMHFISALLILVLILVIPGIGIYKAYKSSGTFRDHFRNACKPTDWFPVEPADRQRYEVAVGNSEMTIALCEPEEDAL